MNDAVYTDKGLVLLHPVVLLCLGLWALNDHLLKPWFPGPVTGKLSDLTSLVVFPLLATTCTELLVPGLSTRGRRHALIYWTGATALVMATINVLEPAAFAYRWGLGAAQWPAYAVSAWIRGLSAPQWQPVTLTMDPSDLWTLPMVVLTVGLGWPSRTAVTRHAHDNVTEGDADATIWRS